MDESAFIKAIHNIVEGEKPTGYEQNFYEKACQKIDDGKMLKEQEQELQSLLPALEKIMNTHTQKAFLGQSAQMMHHL